MNQLLKVLSLLIMLLRKEIPVCDYLVDGLFLRVIGHRVVRRYCKIILCAPVLTVCGINKTHFYNCVLLNFISSFNLSWHD